MREDILTLVRHKNLHRLAELLGENTQCCDLIKKAAVLPEDPERALETLGEICSRQRGAGVCIGTQASVDVLKSEGFGDKTVIDLSIINETGYYNGIAFHGYISGQPGAVLSGGAVRQPHGQDGKEPAGSGICDIYRLYFTDTCRGEREYDCDVLLVYGEAGPEAVLRRVGELHGGGQDGARCGAGLRRVQGKGEDKPLKYSVY